MVPVLATFCVNDDMAACIRESFERAQSSPASKKTPESAQLSGQLSVLEVDCSPTWASEWESSSLRTKDLSLYQNDLTPNEAVARSPTIADIAMLAVLGSRYAFAGAAVVSKANASVADRQIRL